MPTPTTKTRQGLKARFARGAIPTEVDFSDLIEASLCQADDGLFKLPDEPLSLVRQNSDQAVLRFFEDPAAAGSAWQIQLSAEGQSGFAVANQDGKVNLFIDRATGNVGVGTTAPAARLTVQSESSSLEGSTDPQSRLRYSGQMAIRSPGPQLDFIETAGRVHWAIHVNDGRMHFLRSPWETSDFVLDGNTGNVGIGTDQPQQKLHVNGTAQVNTLRVDELWVAGIKSMPDRDSGSQFISLINGNTGICESKPTQKLVVYDERYVTETSKDPASKVTHGGHLSIKAPTPQIDFIVSDPDRNQNNWAIQVSSGKMLFVRSPWEVADLVLDGLGNVGIGTITPKSRLHVEGVARVDSLIIENMWMLGAGFYRGKDDWLRLLNAGRKDWFDGSLDDYLGGLSVIKVWAQDGGVQGSDIRLKIKDSIRAVRHALPRLLELVPVEFRFLSDSKRRYPRLGFIAQEVEAVCPEAVEEGPRGMKGIQASCLMALLAQAIQEQNAQLDCLEARITGSP